jgi:hypothetical protein
MRWSAGSRRRPGRARWPGRLTAAGSAAPGAPAALDRTAPAEIGRVVGMDAAAVRRRIERIIGRLRAETPVAAS